MSVKIFKTWFEYTFETFNIIFQLVSVLVKIVLDCKCRKPSSIWFKEIREFIVSPNRKLQGKEQLQDPGTQRCHQDLVFPLSSLFSSLVSQTGLPLHIASAPISQCYFSSQWKGVSFSYYFQYKVLELKLIGLLPNLSMWPGSGSNIPIAQTELHAQLWSDVYEREIVGTLQTTWTLTER